MEAKARRGGRMAAPRPEAAADPAPSPAPAEPTPAAPELAANPADEALSALLESQAAVARGLTALGVEMTELARSGIDAAGKSASELLSARTFADAVEINAGFARHSFEALLGGSARLSEIGVKLAAEASRPIIAQLNRDWMKPAR